MMDDDQDNPALRRLAAGLLKKLREKEALIGVIGLAGQVNTAMPDYVVETLARALDDRFQKGLNGLNGLNGSKILILGLAYKKNVDDLRESPSLRLVEKLRARGASVDYHDPFIPVIPVTREHASLADIEGMPWDLETIAHYDAVLIATDHDGVDYLGLAKTAKLVVDTRYACARAGAQLDRVVLTCPFDRRRVQALTCAA